MHLGTLLLASAPCACHVMPLLGSSSLFHASSKVWKTLGPFVKKVLRPPAGTLRGPTCSFYCVLQVKLALGLIYPHELQQLFGGPQRPPGGPQEASKRPPCSHAPKRPPRGPQEAQSSQRGPLAHKRVTSVSQTCRALSTLGQPRRDTRSVNT